MFGLRSNSPRQRTVRLSVLGLALVIWFQGCQCDEGGFTTITVPVRNVGTGSGQVDIPTASNDARCDVGAADATSSNRDRCSLEFEDVGQGGNFQLNPTPSAGSAFVRWVAGPCTGLPTHCNLSFAQNAGDFTFGEVTVEFALVPTLSAITPNSATSGAVPVVVNATLNGTNLQGATSVSVTGGILTSGLVVQSPLQLAVTLTIPPGTTGTKTVTVTTPAGTTNGISFAVSVPPPPTLTSITPATGVSGSPPFTVTIVGTGFDATTSTTATPGSGIQLSNFTVVSATQLTTTLTIPANTPADLYNVAVTTQFGTSNSLPFQVTAPPAPILGEVVPNSGGQGSTLSVRLRGSGFAATGNVVNVSGAGITVSGVARVGAEIGATFAIAATAPLGSRNVTVVAGGATSNAVPFTVVAALHLTSITPSGGAFGQVVNVSIVGTGFRPGLALSAPQGITVSNLVVVDATHLTATFTIGNNAPFGNNAITVSVGTEVSNTIFFNIV